MLSYIQRFIAWLDYPSWVWAIIGLYLLLPIIFYVILPAWYENRYYSSSAKDDANHKSLQALVIVLGDLGHSPRMCYHVKNLVSVKHYKVYLFGYIQSALPEYIQRYVESGDVVIVEIPVMKSSGNMLVSLISKVLGQHWTLFRLLFRSELKNSRYVLIQNPPILPILHVVILWRLLYSPVSRIIIDWHNLNYLILNMKFSDLSNKGSKAKLIKRVGTKLVAFMRWYEFNLSKVAWLNLTVSENMKDFLLDAIYPRYSSIERAAAARKYLVLHDRPANHFKVLSETERRDYITKKYTTYFQTKELENFDFLGKDRLLVSSTSFTKDEDFDILLDAMKLYDQSKGDRKIFLLVTGKGPEKDHFFERIQELKFSNRVIIKNYWFSQKEYPEIISLADLAISLHLSSSGIDLPMKILDFFGCGIPTISVNFKTISELVKNGENGYILEKNTPKELFETISRIISDDRLYDTLKRGAEEESHRRWDDNWGNVLGNAL